MDLITVGIILAICLSVLGIKRDARELVQCNEVINFDAQSIKFKINKL